MARLGCSEIKDLARGFEKQLLRYAIANAVNRALKSNDVGTALAVLSIAVENGLHEFEKLKERLEVLESLRISTQRVAYYMQRAVEASQKLLEDVSDGKLDKVHEDLQNVAKILNHVTSILENDLKRAESLGINIENVRKLRELVEKAKSIARMCESLSRTAKDLATFVNEFRKLSTLGEVRSVDEAVQRLLDIVNGMNRALRRIEQELGSVPEARDILEKLRSYFRVANGLLDAYTQLSAAIENINSGLEIYAREGISVAKPRLYAGLTQYLTAMKIVEHLIGESASISPELNHALTEFYAKLLQNYKELKKKILENDTRTETRKVFEEAEKRVYGGAIPVDIKPKSVVEQFFDAVSAAVRDIVEKNKLLWRHSTNPLLKAIGLVGLFGAGIIDVATIIVRPRELYNSIAFLANGFRTLVMDPNGWLRGARQVLSELGREFSYDPAAFIAQMAGETVGTLLLIKGIGRLLPARIRGLAPYLVDLVQGDPLGLALDFVDLTSLRTAVSVAAKKLGKSIDVKVVSNLRLTSKAENLVKTFIKKLDLSNLIRFRASSLAKYLRALGDARLREDLKAAILAKLSGAANLAVPKEVVKALKHVNLETLNVTIETLKNVEARVRNIVPRIETALKVLKEAGLEKVGLEEALEVKPENLKKLLLEEIEKLDVSPETKANLRKLVEATVTQPVPTKMIPSIRNALRDLAKAFDEVRALQEEIAGLLESVGNDLPPDIRKDLQKFYDTCRNLVEQLRSAKLATLDLTALSNVRATLEDVKKHFESDVARYRGALESALRSLASDVESAAPDIATKLRELADEVRNCDKAKMRDLVKEVESLIEELSARLRNVSLDIKLVEKLVKDLEKWSELPLIRSLEEAVKELRKRLSKGSVEAVRASEKGIEMKRATTLLPPGFVERAGEIVKELNELGYRKEAEVLAQIITKLSRGEFSVADAAKLSDVARRLWGVTPSIKSFFKNLVETLEAKVRGGEIKSKDILPFLAEVRKFIDEMITLPEGKWALLYSEMGFANVVPSDLVPLVCAKEYLEQAKEFFTRTKVFDVEINGARLKGRRTGWLGPGEAGIRWELEDSKGRKIVYELRVRRAGRGRAVVERHLYVDPELDPSVRQVLEQLPPEEALRKLFPDLDKLKYIYVPKSPSGWVSLLDEALKIGTASVLSTLGLARSSESLSKDLLELVEFINDLRKRGRATVIEISDPNDLKQLMDFVEAPLLEKLRAVLQRFGVKNMGVALVETSQGVVPFLLLPEIDVKKLEPLGIQLENVEIDFGKIRLVLPAIRGIKSVVPIVPIKLKPRTEPSLKGVEENEATISANEVGTTISTTTTTVQIQTHKSSGGIPPRGTPTTSTASTPPLRGRGTYASLRIGRVGGGYGTRVGEVIEL